MVERPFIVTQGYEEESYEEFCARMESNVDEKQKMNIMKELQNKRKVGLMHGQQE